MKLLLSLISCLFVFAAFTTDVVIAGEAECYNLVEPFFTDGGEKMWECRTIADLETKRGRECKKGAYKEKCSGLCKNRCECFDYEHEFTAKESSENLITCEALINDWAVDKCKFKRVKKNCPTLCNSKCQM